jgi:hypothetical protein
MSKYEPLGQFLRQQDALYLPMRFAEIESVLGSKLPPSSKGHRAWWSNNPSNNVMTKQWLEAGYETEAVDLAAEKLVFRKVRHTGGSIGKSRGTVTSVPDSGGKYRALGEFLRKQSAEFIAMSFSEIEDIIGSDLPHSKIYPAWWSNNASNNTMTAQWLAAGFQTESVDIASERLVFRKITNRNNPDMKDEDLPDHPIFGCMAGTITVMPGVDLTEPMEFEWSGKLYNE